MNYTQLFDNILKKRSFLCVGLDPVLEKMPESCRTQEHPLFHFNKAIIDATAPYAVAYKPNCAFYEAYGVHGWQQFEQTVRYIKENYPDILVIADAKRGDIGNTAKMYAKAFYENLPCDAVTLAPYMGSDSITPFLQYEEKWAIVLAMTSNASAEEYETLQLCTSTAEPHQASASAATEPEPHNASSSAQPLFERVIRNSMQLAGRDNLMFVVGATRPQKLKEIRAFCPDNFLLVPGVGAQGGTLPEVAANGMNSHCGLLVNSSRGIIYAGKDENFAQASAAEAAKIAKEMAAELAAHGLL